MLPELVVLHGKAMGHPVWILDRWRRDDPADGPDDLRHGDLNPALRRLVDPERFDDMMTAAAWVEERRSGSPQRGDRRGWSHIRPMLMHDVMQLDGWLSSAGRG